MALPRNGRSLIIALFLAAAAATACAPTYVIVPEQRGGFGARDTLHGRLKGKDVLVTFHYDTTWRVDTVTRWRTIYREGARVDTVFVIDTLRVGPGGRRYYGRVDTVRVADTVLVGTGGRRYNPRVDTVRVVVHDTVRITQPGGPTRPGIPGGPIIMPRPPTEGRVDTVRIRVTDTIRVAIHDTIRRVDTLRIRSGSVDTVRIPGRRTLFVPPGQYPPRGECRVWIVDRPPGQQARAAACNALGSIPSGAFILFNGEAWDADYEWSADPNARGVPPEILALQRRRGR